MHVEHLRIPVGAGHLHAERVGRGGLPVVLLHGFGTCAYLWRNVAPHLANAGYTALSLDLLGYGESERPADAAYSIAAQAEYVDRALTALRMPGAVLVGQDLGAAVALLVAARHPLQIRRLALLNPVDPDDLPPAAVGAVQRASARIAISANELFGALPLLEVLLTNGVSDRERMSDLLVARYAAPFIGSDGVEELLVLASAAEVSLEDPIDYSAVSTDTLLVRGGADKWSDADTAAQLALRMTAATTHVETISDAGHLLAEDAPETLVRLLLEWLAAPSTGSTQDRREPQAQPATHSETRSKSGSEVPSSQSGPLGTGSLSS